LDGGRRSELRILVLKRLSRREKIPQSRGRHDPFRNAYTVKVFVTRTVAVTTGAWS
jgi:hypothetical protein